MAIKFMLALILQREKKKLMDMARDTGFIRVIYNYCDRWCEQCTQTLKCLNYSIAKEDFADPESPDICNEDFWEKSQGYMKTLSPF